MLEKADKLSEAASKALHRMLPADPGSDHDCEGRCESHVRDMDLSPDIAEVDVEDELDFGGEL